MKIRNLIFLKLIYLLFFFSISYSQTDTIITPYNVVKIKSIGEVVLSPDGRLIAYTVIVPRDVNDEPGFAYRELYVMKSDGSNQKPFISGKVSIGNITFSPDGKLIVFTARFENDKATQVYAIPVDGGEKFKLFETTESVLQFKYHPNGKVIYYTSQSPVPDKIKNLQRKGFNQIIYEEDWQHINLYKYDLEKKKSEQITSDCTVFDFVVSNTGKYIAAAIAPRNLVDDSYMFKRIHLIDLETNQKELLIDNPGKLGNFEFSPDDKYLVFNSAVDIYDPASSSMFVVEVPNKNKKFTDLKNYSDKFEGTVNWVGWKDNQTLLFTAEEGVYLPLSEQNINAPSRKLITPANTVVRRAIFDKNSGNFILVLSKFNHPNEIYLFNKKGEFRRLTNVNSWLDKFKFARQEEVRYNARDGLEITGVLIYPLNYEEGKRYPLIVNVHGGPEAADQNAWITSYGSWGQMAAARGYFVFMPNYRASNGRGVEFSKMGQMDLGGKEFDDVIDGIDYLINKGLVDKDRVGIGGGSYGGYFSAWAATKYSDRFAGAVMFVGISNQISKRGTTDIPYEDYYVHWRIWSWENFDLVWDRSPLKYVTNCKTPILILHGKEDPRVSVTQSMELYRALKILNQAPVRLVLYPGEGHGNARTQSRLDYAIRTMEWFDFYVRDKNSFDKIPDKYIDYKID
ncbi:MAG: S9 family peptidase [Ignavibacteria bacterium]|jgi:dipeptidyl aminopeptidase/acylaminoacyl peptidase|nr:S9 family peptidase [Ignavibacteria bacterium]MDH7527151.1 S9 family peptidase [Ignavibacteria bacterium]